MKILFSIAALLLCQAYTCVSQVNSEIKDQFHHVLRLIKYDSAEKLAQYIAYPLKRGYPLSSIKNKEEFITYYRTIFDATFKRELSYFKDSDIMEHNGGYGLVSDYENPDGSRFDGDFWMKEDGTISWIGIRSKKELKLQEEMTNKIRNEIYPDIKDWERNDVVCKTNNYLIRVDYTKKGYRYVSWRSGKKVSDEPDLILYDGDWEADGEIGGSTWTFKSGKWKYVIDDVEECEKDSDCGLFLELYYDGVLKSSVRCVELDN